MSSYDHPHTTPETAYAEPESSSGLAIAAVALSTLLGVLWLGQAVTAIPIAREIESGTRYDDLSFGVVGPYSLAALLSVPVFIAVFVVTGLWILRARSIGEKLSPFV